MKTATQAQREARRLFGLCLVNGSVDEERARDVVHRLVDGGRQGRLATLSRFQRLVRLDARRHRAEVTSAAPLAPDIRAQIEAVVMALHGPGIVSTFSEDPSLVGGVRVTVGSDVYDGTIKAMLDSLEARF
jgi:F-type H+-transporting ATPase subunit delta